MVVLGAGDFMSGAFVASGIAQLVLPTWDDISGVHTGTLSLSSPHNSVRSAALIPKTYNWTDPGHSFKLGSGDSGSLIQITNGGSLNNKGPNNYYADATAAVGPVVINISSPGYVPTTFTVNLS